MLRFTASAVHGGPTQSYYPSDLRVGTILDDGYNPNLMTVIVAQTSNTEKQFIVISAVNFEAGGVWDGVFFGKPRVSFAKLDVEDYPLGTVVQEADSYGTLWRTIKPELTNEDSDTIYAVDLNDPTHFLTTDIIQGRVIPHEALRMEVEE